MSIDKIKLLAFSIIVIASTACSSNGIIYATAGSIGVVREFPRIVCTDSEADFGFVEEATDYVNEYLGKAIFEMGDESCDITVSMGDNMGIYDHDPGINIVGVTLTAYDGGFIDFSEIQIESTEHDSNTRKILVHELGHALGFGHSERGIMELHIDFGRSLDVLMNDCFDVWFGDIYGDDL